MNPEEFHSGVSWRCVDTGLRDGRFNMAFDEDLAWALLSDEGPPTVRVYGWQPSAISLGFHQNENEIDEVRCRAEGIDVVRRPTGGRAILHADEITYSVVMWADGRSVMDVYRQISRALLRGLGLLGVSAEIAGATSASIRYDGGEETKLCFASTSKFEIQYQGKKIVGSAQRRYANPLRSDEVVLQHGSILLGPEHRKLVDLLALPNHRARHILQTSLEAKTTEVETVLRRQVSYSEAAVAVRRGFEEAWGIRFSTPPEELAIEHLDNLEGTNPFTQRTKNATKAE